MDKSTSCTFTGHRPSKLPWHSNENDIRCIELKRKIYDAVQAVYSGGIRHYICGMATGCDTYFCEAVMELRREHEEVTIEAAIPCQEQSDKWDRADRERYSRLCTECDYVTVVKAHYTPECYKLRNKYMVDNASVLIAAYDGLPGGTASTIFYAIRQGLEIIELPL